jgi:hypothetical protein
MVDRLLRQDETLEQLRADFLARVQVTTSGCWLWDGDAERYGNFRGEPAHRVSWELHQGPIGEGLYILHGCDIAGAERASYGCVNPTHIRPGTPKENAQDLARARKRARARRSQPVPDVERERDVIKEFFSCSHEQITRKARYQTKKHLGFEFSIFWDEGICQHCFETVQIGEGPWPGMMGRADLIVAMRLMKIEDGKLYYSDPFKHFVRRLAVPIPDLAKQMDVPLCDLAHALRGGVVNSAILRKLCAVFVEAKSADYPADIIADLRGDC